MLSGLSDEIARIGLTAGELAAMDINTQMQSLVDGLTDLGQATAENIAHVEAWANAMRDAQVADIFGDIQADLDGLTMSDFERELAGIDRQAEEYVLSLLALDRATSENVAQIDAWADSMYAAAHAAQARASAEAALKEAEAAAADAEADLRAAYEAEADALDATIGRLDDFTRSIRDFRESLWVSDASPLTGQQQLSLSESRFNDLAARAAAGDEEAMQELQGASEEYLRLLEDQSSDASDYYRKFAQVQNVLESTESTATRELDTARAQLDSLNAVVGGLIDINDSVLSVEAAISALQSSLSALATAQAAVPAAPSAPSAPPLPTNSTSAFDTAVSAAFSEVLGRTPEAAGLDYWSAQLESGAVSMGRLEEAIAYGAQSGDQASARDWLKENGFISPFWTGGYTGPGGKYEPAGIVHKGEVVFSQDDVARWGGVAAVESLRRAPGYAEGGPVSIAPMPLPMRTRDDANDALLREVEALRREIALLRAPAEATARNTGRMDKNIDRVTEGGRAMQVETYA